jgi:type VI secretion system secreted protein Hcp
MALLAYMWAKGQKSGPINGSVTQKGRENSIAVLGYSHQMFVPLNSSTGLPAGARMHKPLVITKETDKSTPLFYQILCTNENLTSVTLKFWTPQLKAASGVGSEVQHYTITLTNANVSSIDGLLQDVKHGDQSAQAQTETIAFTYQKIEWLWTDGGISSSDDWESGV